ncbi:MAG: relaxase/mobilization nuclease domain-containing protein, partial [Candidatus Competibacteraceae bacterium]|nr:relaxase/mobilization nuclease domain-containing protein [Candidatus Competibacteraceae bacterium]
MIVKKVRNPRRSSSTGVRITRLADYIDAPEYGKQQQENPKTQRIEGLGEYLHNPVNIQSQEKCIYSGARGFQAKTHAGQKAEMRTLAQEAVRSKDPINHYVLSWQEGEQPTPKQVEQAVDLFLEELGLQDHQVFFGLHVDTDNVHLHLMINRVHPDTLRVIKPNKGFDLEAAPRAIARFEHAQ